MTPCVHRTWTPTNILRPDPMVLCHLPEVEFGTFFYISQSLRYAKPSVYTGCLKRGELLAINNWDAGQPTRQYMSYSLCIMYIHIHNYIYIYTYMYGLVIYIYGFFMHRFTICTYTSTGFCHMCSSQHSEVGCRKIYPSARRIKLVQRTATQETVWVVVERCMELSWGNLCDGYNSG